MSSKFYAGIGSRETPIEILDEMSNIARYLETKGYTLRSGGAGGADIAFSDVVDNAQIWVPWSTFYKTNRPHSIKTIDINDTEAFNSVSDFHPSPFRLKKGGIMLMARNYRQVVGLNEPNSEFIVCWTKDGKDSGGTGQAIRIAKSLGIAIINLKIQRFFYDQ